jgi:hypothetical protein
MSSPTSLLTRTSLVFLPLAVVATCLAGLVYVVAQQGLRTGADGLPLGRALDAAAALDAGIAPETVVASGAWIGSATVDVAHSLSPFVVVFDAGGRVLAANAQLDGASPVPPLGVLSAATSDRPNRVTWQPRPGVRIATVTARWSGGAVMVGQSLREVERRVDQVLVLVAVGWIATLAALAVSAFAVSALWLRGAPTRP